MRKLIILSIIALALYQGVITLYYQMAELEYKDARKQISAWSEKYANGDVASANLLEQKKYQLALQNIDSAIDKDYQLKYIKTKAELIEWGEKFNFTVSSSTEQLSEQ